MKRILIEWFHYEGKQPSHRASGRVEELIANVVESMRPFLRTMQIQLDVRPLKLTKDEVELAGTVRINGKRAQTHTDEEISLEALTDAILKETARFTRGCAGNPEDLHR